MHSITSKLKNKIAVYGRAFDEEPIKNQLGEEEESYREIKTVWAEILPYEGREATGQGNTIYAEISHKIKVRVGSIPNLSNDMYFIFKGQRYDIRYFNPNYTTRDLIEIFCELVVE